jgi:hypothetical protein
MEPSAKKALAVAPVNRLTAVPAGVRLPASSGENRAQHNSLAPTVVGGGVISLPKPRTDMTDHGRDAGPIFHPASNSNSADRLRG